MTPDLLHYALLLSAWVALALMIVAGFVIHGRSRRRSSLLMLIGLLIAGLGQLLQLFSPIYDLAYEEFRGIVVSSGSLPSIWYAGSLVTSFGAVLAALSFLLLAVRWPARTPKRSDPSSGR